MGKGREYSDIEDECKRQTTSGVFVNDRAKYDRGHALARLRSRE